MDSMEFNKIMGAVLTAGIAFAGLGLVADNAVHPERLAKSAIDIKGADAPAASQAMASNEPVIPPIAPLLIKANPADGEALTKKICVACHNFNQGGANKVGPLLYGVVGREQASAPGYTYSKALSSHHAKWTYAELNKWLLKPAAYAPGTKMAYAGISNDQTRADVIDYLRTLAPSPEPLPTAAEAAAETQAAAKAAPAAAAGAPAADALPPLAPLLASANIGDGQALTKKICIACHNFNEGGGNKVGPALYGVVGRHQASAPGYTYSSALKKHMGDWTYAELNTWLYKPSAYAPGTKMAYAGISNPQIRADVIDYLHTLSHNPLPLPVTDARAAAPGAPGTAGTPANTYSGSDKPAGASPAVVGPAGGAQQAPTTGHVAPASAPAEKSDAAPGAAATPVTEPSNAAVTAPANPQQSGVNGATRRASVPADSNTAPASVTATTPH